MRRPWLLPAGWRRRGRGQEGWSAWSRPFASSRPRAGRPKETTSLTAATASVAVGASRTARGSMSGWAGSPVRWGIPGRACGVQFRVHRCRLRTPRAGDWCGFCLCGRRRRAGAERATAPARRFAELARAARADPRGAGAAGGHPPRRPGPRDGPAGPPCVFRIARPGAPGRMADVDRRGAGVGGVERRPVVDP